MMLDSTAPRFAMCGKLADIIPNAWEVKRRRLHTARLAAAARRATAQVRIALALLLALSFVVQTCIPRPAIEVEPRQPRHRITDWYPSDYQQ